MKVVEEIMNNKLQFISELNPVILEEAINIMKEESLNYEEKIALICQINIHRTIESLI